MFKLLRRMDKRTKIDRYRDWEINLSYYMEEMEREVIKINNFMRRPEQTVVNFRNNL